MSKAKPTRTAAKRTSHSSQPGPSVPTDEPGQKPGVRSPAPPQKKIFLVDDHPLFREGLAAMIAREPDLVVCGQAETAAQALDGINRCQPDLVLMDLSLPGRGGLELTKDLRALHPALLVLVVSMHDESLFAAR